MTVGPRRLRSTAAAAALMLPRLFDLFAVLVALIVFFAWLGVLLFAGPDTHFATFKEAVYSLCMLLTSTNFPDVALPVRARSV